MAMSDHERVQKTIQLQARISIANNLMQELVADGCRVDADFGPSYQAINWENPCPVLKVEVYQKIEP